MKEGEKEKDKNKNTFPICGRRKQSRYAMDEINGWALAMV